MAAIRFVTSESVTEGHPDKLCDQVADAILDAYLGRDPAARVAVEVMASGNTLFIGGEITSSADIDIAAIARGVVARIGYDDHALGFDAAGCFVLTDIRRQSPDIALGVSRGSELGAGDQGVVHGYACDETPALMPLPIELAHRLARSLARIRRDGSAPWLRPDGKTQVTLRYENTIPVALTSVVVSAQHDALVARETLVRTVVEKVVVGEMGKWLRPDTRVLINPTGRFVLGGPAADTGLTGRKLMVDTYGGCANHGGGAFSGKDPSKIDRSAAYMARYIAKNLVHAGLARRCAVSLAFAIGQAEPEMVDVCCFGTERIEERRMVDLVRKIFPLSVSGIIEGLDLRRPIYGETSCYGHFGAGGKRRPWERTDRSRELRFLAGI